MPKTKNCKWLPCDTFSLYWNNEATDKEKNFHFYYIVNTPSKSKKKRGSVKILRTLSQKTAENFLKMPTALMLSNADNINLLQAGQTIDDQNCKLKY